MKLNDIYSLAVTEGIEADPRGVDKVEEALKRVGEQFDELKKEEKEEFDEEKLTNPYEDTRILFGSPEVEVNKLFAGIDIGGEEFLLADRIGPFDLVISHHPQGKALASLHGVMDLQEDVLHDLGVPINVAEGLMEPRIKEVERNLLPANHNRSVDFARLLDIPFMCVHTPADNMVVRYLEKMFEKENPKTVGEVIELLKDIPEYKKAIEYKAGPRCIVGSEKRRAGKIFVDMTGGTGGSEDAFGKLADAGVGTIVAMHMGERHRKEAEKNHINVVIAGHIASDSIGLNLFLDMLETKGIEINSCSGLIRFSRNE